MSQISTELSSGRLGKFESLTTNEVSAILFEGDIAVFAPEMPAGIRLTHAGDLQSPSLGSDSPGRRLEAAGTRAGSYRVHCAKPGVHPLKLEVIARIIKAEPWNHISFTGPPAATAAGLPAGWQLLTVEFAKPPGNDAELAWAGFARVLLTSNAFLYVD